MTLLLKEIINNISSLLDVDMVEEDVNVNVNYVEKCDILSLLTCLDMIKTLFSILQILDLLKISQKCYIKMTE